VALSAFEDPAAAPSREELVAVLGPATLLWDDLVTDVKRRADAVTEGWNHAGPKFGWSMRLVLGDRILVRLTPQVGRLLVGVTLGKKAIDLAATSGGASERTLEVVAVAPRYAEGRGVRFPVATVDDLLVAEELCRIKLGW
jgi:hypothetical protein